MSKTISLTIPYEPGALATASTMLLDMARLIEQAGGAPVTDSPVRGTVTTTLPAAIESIQVDGVITAPTAGPGGSGGIDDDEAHTEQPTDEPTTAAGHRLARVG